VNVGEVVGFHPVGGIFLFCEVFGVGSFPLTSRVFMYYVRCTAKPRSACTLQENDLVTSFTLAGTTQLTPHVDYAMQHYNRRGHDGGDERRGQGGGRGFGGRGFGALPQRTDVAQFVQVLINRWRLEPSSPQDNESSDYIQYRVTIKNGWYKRIASNEGTTTTAGGEEVQRVFESKEISIKDMDRMATASAIPSMPWRIMKKLVLDEPYIEVAYDGNQKAYSPSDAVGPVDGQEYRVKVKRDCENDDPDSDRVKDRWYVSCLFVPFCYIFY